MLNSLTYLLKDYLVKSCWMGLEKEINQFTYKFPFLNHLT